MAGILVLAEQIRGQVRDASLDALAAAVSLKEALGGLVAAAVVAADPEAYASALNVPGVDEVLLVPAGSEAFDPDVAAGALDALVRERAPALVLLGQSVNASGVAAAVAARAGLGFASNVVSVAADTGEVRATRETLGGKVEVELDFPGVPGVVIALRSAGRALREGMGTAAVTRVELPPDAARLRSRHVGYEEVAAGGVDLSKAPFILTVGRGIGDKDNLAIFEGLAAKAGAAMGSSRPLVDAGWMPRERQVGQSGATVKPAVYLAFGVSGANEHLAGMRESGTIIAVNTDPRARIFDVADFGAVADACDVAEELAKIL
jgi:electron transfer flavoprotein alpha subunit